MNRLSRSKTAIAATLAIFGSALAASAPSYGSAPTSLNAAQGIAQAGGYVPKAALPPENVVKDVSPQSLDGLTVVRRPRGLTPKQWGMSAACKRMVRKNRLLGAGVSAQRI